MRDGPEQKHDGKSTGQRRKDVDHSGRIFGAAAKEGKKPSDDHKKRRPGRMPYFQFKRGGYKLTTIPETYRGFDGH